MHCHIVKSTFKSQNRATAPEAAILQFISNLT